MENMFSIDLEDWFYVERESSTGTKEWADFSSNLQINTLNILNLLDSKNIKGTFFVLGKLAEHEADLIKEISGRGHEIASHGYSHKIIDEMTKDEFREDIEKSIDSIVKSCGRMPLGYRAPKFSINKRTEWAFDILKEFGFIYDSSIYPISIHPDYGSVEFDINPFRHETGIIELPLSFVNILGIRVPFSGGGYFRLYPYTVFSSMIKYTNKRNRPVIFYLHPWELNNTMPVSGKSIILKYRQNINIKNTFKKLNRLVNDFNFESIEMYIRKNLMEI